MVIPGHVYCSISAPITTCIILEARHYQASLTSKYGLCIILLIVKVRVLNALLCKSPGIGYAVSYNEGKVVNISE